MRLLASLALAVATALALAGCTVANTELHRPAMPVTPVGYQLSAPSVLPPELKEAGIESALQLPPGWVVDGYGIRRTGRWLTFGAETISSLAALTQGHDVPPESFWVVDTRSGRTVSYGPDTGWAFANPVIAGGWAVVREIRARSGRTCPSDATRECFDWRVEAYPVPGTKGAARRLAASTKPVGPAAVPLIVYQDDAVAWEQGDTASSSRVYYWTPAAARPVMLEKIRGQEELSFDSGKLYVSQSPLADGASRHTVTQIPLPGQTGTMAPVSYTGSTADTVCDSRLVYFPEAGDQTAAWRSVTLGGDSKATELKPAVTGPYGIECVDRDHLVGYSASGVQLYDLATGGTTQIAPATTVLTTPRGHDGYVDLAWNSPTNQAPSVIGWRHG